MTWETLASALESPQGSTFYALLMLFMLAAVSLWLQRRVRPQQPDGPVGSLLSALMGIRGIEVLVFAAAWLAQDPKAAQAMPALERAIHLASLSALLFLWARQPESERKQQTLFGLLMLLSASLGVVIMLMWQFTPSATTFNYSDLDYAWGAACLVALLIGAVQIFRTGRVLGLVMVVAFAIGQLFHMILAEPFGNMPLAAQAVHLAIMPLLFLLPVGAALAPKPRIKLLDKTPDEENAGAGEEVVDEPFPEFFDFDAEQAPAFEGQAATAVELAQQTAQNFEADVCSFVHVDQDLQVLTLEAGYNVLRSAAVEPATIALERVPQLHSALLNSEPMRIFAEDHTPELTVMSQALRLSFQAHLLALPLADVNEPGWAVLLLSLERPWQLDDESKLEAAAEALSRELNEFLTPLDEDGLPEPPAAVAQSAAESQTETESQPAQPVPTQPTNERLAITTGKTPEQLELENERYREDIDRLLAHIDELKSEQASSSSQAAVNSNGVVQALQMENERLKAALAGAESSAPVVMPMPIETAQAKEELRLAMEEVAALHEQLANAQRDILAGVAQPPSPSDTQPVVVPMPKGAAGESDAVEPGRKIAANQVEVVASIAQELRQPLSSVVGYTDLLLGESVGILGALQRKFLERVRKSAERMNTLIDNLIRIAELDQAGYSAVRKPVELAAVIDDAIGQLRPQLQEKRIALRVDLPPQLPELNTDRDALQQILYHLLQNADAATPAEGSITLRAFIDQQKELGEFVLVQVSDTGGGIPDEYLPRVFSRVYRASNPVIPGVGDTGVGLTIAETLTQALGGRIWVESQAGQGATFSVLLPMQP